MADGWIRRTSMGRRLSNQLKIALINHERDYRNRGHWSKTSNSKESTDNYLRPPLILAIVLPTEHDVRLSIKSATAAIFSNINNGRIRMIIIRMNCAILLVLSDNMPGAIISKEYIWAEGWVVWGFCHRKYIGWARDSISLVFDFSRRTMQLRRVEWGKDRRENWQKEMELGRPDQEEDGEEEVFFSYKKRRVFEVFRSPVAALHKFMQPLRPVHGLTYWRRVSLNSQRQHCYLRGDWMRMRGDSNFRCRSTVTSNNSEEISQNYPSMDAPIKLANSPSKCLLTYLRTCLISENLSYVLKLNFRFPEVLKYLLLKYPFTPPHPHPNINSTTHHDLVFFPSDYSLIRLFSYLSLT